LAGRLRVAANRSKAILREQAVQHCRSYALRAERKLGQMLAQMDKAKNRYSSGNNLLLLGIDRMQSHRWQQAAKVSEEDFREYMARCDNDEREATSAGLYKLASPKSENNLKRQRLRQAARIDERIIVGDFREKGNILADSSVA
jgi:hypothetical protein